MPTVGIVIPSFQAELWLLATLRSVLGQTFTDWTCVVVDDGSTDGTAGVAAVVMAEDDRVRLVQQENRGLSGARNSGLAALPEVDLVAFLDSDDLWLPDTLLTLVGAAQRRPDAVGVYGLAELIDETGARVQPGVHPARQHARRRYRAGRWPGRIEPVAETADLDLPELTLYNPFWPPATGLLRSTAVQAAGPFDESYRVQEDWNMWLRVTRGGPLVPVDRLVAEYRQHGTNLTRDWRANFLQQDRLRWELVHDDGQPGSIRRHALRAWRCELWAGARYESKQAVRAVRTRNRGDVVAGLVRAGAASVRALTPGGPRPTGWGVRWRPRGTLS